MLLFAFSIPGDLTSLRMKFLIVHLSDIHLRSSENPALAKFPFVSKALQNEEVDVKRGRNPRRVKAPEENARFLRTQGVFPIKRTLRPRWDAGQRVLKFEECSLYTATDICHSRINWRADALANGVYYRLASAPRQFEITVMIPGDKHEVDF